MGIIPPNMKHWHEFLLLLYLLFIFQKACKVVKIHNLFLIAVGDHYQVQVSACGNHLIERTEFFKAQRALVFVCVCVLQITTKIFYNTLSVCDLQPCKRKYVPP